MLELNRRTRKIRTYTAGTCLKILTPRFYDLVKDSIDIAEDNGFPRPSTRLIQSVYGEKPLVGVEIGTGFGENALNLLNSLCLDRLYCIDPFIPYSDGQIKVQTGYLSKSEETLKKLAEFDNVTIIKKCSSDAWKELPDNLDFVYVDGNHNYEYVMADLHNYYPLVHEKGLIAGHDIEWFDVERAVADFCRITKVTPLIRSPDWIILK
jgi:hypothetical protein